MLNMYIYYRKHIQGCSRRTICPFQSPLPNPHSVTQLHQQMRTSTPVSSECIMMEISDQNESTLSSLGGNPTSVKESIPNDSSGEEDPYDLNLDPLPNDSYEDLFCICAARNKTNDKHFHGH